MSCYKFNTNKEAQAGAQRQGKPVVVDSIMLDDYFDSQISGLSGVFVHGC